MVNIDEAMAALPDEIKKIARLGLDVAYERLETPSLGLTAALNGGFGTGRMGMIYGPKSAGKTLFATQFIALQQKAGKVCAFLDAEGTYDPDWGARLGVDNENLIHMPVVSVNNFVDGIIGLVNSGVDVIVVDSITSLVPSYFVEDNNEFKSFDKTGRIGANAADFSRGIPMIVGALNGKDAFVLMISQTRNTSAGMYFKQAPTGGQAPAFYSSTIISLFSSHSQDNVIVGDVTIGDRVIKKSIGRRVTYTVVNNKSAAEGYEGTYNMYFEGENVGIDSVGELLDMGVDAGEIIKKGSWYRYGDVAIGQGANAAADWLRSNPEALAKVRAKVLG